MKYKNILDYESNSDAEINFQTIPYDKENNYKDTNKSNVFSDNGAWHGYYLPKDYLINSFMGPLVLSQEVPVNIGKYSNKFSLEINGEKINFKNSKKNIYSIPGKLVIEHKFNEFTVVKELIFINNRTTLISTKIINKSNLKIRVKPKISGSVYLKVKTKSSNNCINDDKFWFKYFKKIENKRDKINIYFNPIIDNQLQEKFIVHYNKNIKKFLTHTKNNDVFYDCYFEEEEIKSGCSWVISSFESFLFSKEKINYSLSNESFYFKENKLRWAKYIKNILEVNSNKKFNNLVIKSLQTLVGNWRSPAGVIKKNFIIPSITYQDFIGAWSWDTWKIVVGVARFDYLLAQDSFESMFDFQIDENDKIRKNDTGMVPDCIFFNYSPERGGKSLNWNERNTKPPLAAWAALEIFKISNDKPFLKRVYPKIVAYNKWWNNNRSIEKDSILRYGATIDKNNNFLEEKTIIEAASWESGMDNAPRFDWDRIKIEKCFYKNVEVGYVIDQISVDLNSFNYLDFTCLEKIAKIIKIKEDISNYKYNGKEVRKFINSYMYNSNTKFYYDIKAKNYEKIIGYGDGIEGMLPLFAKVSTSYMAKQIISNISDKNYNLFIPFPSVSISNERFSAIDYWRGPVWIDQLYFSLKGIKNYNYKLISKTLAEKAIKNMVGLLKGSSIRENYNPLDGRGLATTNFSWSASMIILIIEEIICDNKFKK